MAGKHKLDIQAGESLERGPSCIRICMKHMRQELRPGAAVNETISHKRISGT